MRDAVIVEALNVPPAKLTNVGVTEEGNQVQAQARLVAAHRIGREGELVTQIVAEEVPDTRHIDISAQSELTFEDTPVLARPRSGRTAAIALAVGGVTLAGVLGYMAYKRRR